MSDTERPIAEDPPEDLAGALVLGVLDPHAHQEARARQISDPDFAAEVDAWERRLGSLALCIADRAPSRDLWPEIKKLLPANDEGPGGMAGRWKAAAVAASLLAAGFAGLAIWTGRSQAPPVSPAVVARAPEPQEPMQVALLKPTKGPTAFVATLDRSRKRMTISPGAAHAPKGDLELWMIPPDGAPQPLGVIPADKSASMPMPDAFAGKGDTPIVLAVSEEPKGGSPTGRPTGPVIAAGRFRPV